MARQWKWIGSSGQNSIVIDGLLTSSVAASTDYEKGRTVARILGDIVIFKAATSTGVASFAMGLILIDEGNTNPPDPAADVHAAWLWHKVGFMVPHDAAGDFSPVRYTVDVHGMRKIQGDQRLVLMNKGDAAVLTSVAFGFRVGLKLA